MNTNDLLVRWSHLSPDQIEDEVRSGKDVDSAVQLLGAGTVAQIRGDSLSFAPESKSGELEAVVLLPGVMGSSLSSVRGVTTLVWINPVGFLQGNARYLRMDETGEQDDCGEVECISTGLERLFYLKISLTLNRRARLFEFPYDWRRSITYNAKVLHNSLKHWAGKSQMKFTIVAHSMGGLVSRTYMALYPKEAEKRIKRLVMLGTPNYGSVDAVQTLFNGNSMMDTVNQLNGANDMRDVVRSFPGVYNLLPAPPECFPAGVDYPANWDLYQAAEWRVEGVRQTHLDDARKLHQLLGKSDPQVPLVMFAGCHLNTVMGVQRAFDGDEKPVLSENRGDEGDFSGDGTVPLWSSRLPAASTYYIQEVHRDLPNNDQVIANLLTLINGGTPSLPSHLPPKKHSIFGVSFGVTGGEAPSPDAAQPAPLTAAELSARIQTGTASKDELANMYFAL